MIRKILVVSVLFLTACEPEKTVQKFEGQTQGTTYHVSFWSADKNIDAVELHKSVDAELERLDKQLSNYRADSAIEQFNASTSTQPQEVGAEIVALIEKTRAVSEATHGCYDLTIKPLFDLWGFKGETLTQPTPDALKKTLSQVGLAQLETLDATSCNTQRLCDFSQTEFQFFSGIFNHIMQGFFFPIFKLCKRGF